MTEETPKIPCTYHRNGNGNWMASIVINSLVGLLLTALATLGVFLKMSLDETNEKLKTQTTAIQTVKNEAADALKLVKDEAAGERKEIEKRMRERLAVVRTEVLNEIDIVDDDLKEFRNGPGTPVVERRLTGLEKTIKHKVGLFESQMASLSREIDHSRNYLNITRNDLGLTPIIFHPLPIGRDAPIDFNGFADH